MHIHTSIVPVWISPDEKSESLAGRRLRLIAADGGRCEYQVKVAFGDNEAGGKSCTIMLRHPSGNALLDRFLTPEGIRRIEDTEGEALLVLHLQQPREADVPRN